MNGVRQVRVLVGESVADDVQPILDAGAYEDFRRVCLQFWGVAPTYEDVEDEDILAELRDPMEGELVVGILPTTEATDLYATFGWLQQEPPIAIVLNQVQQQDERVIEAIKALQ